MWKQTQSFIYTIYNISIVHTIKFPIKKTQHTRDSCQFKLHI
jgi:hypothetical protein